jgi:hypothetical protein
MKVRIFYGPAHRSRLAARYGRALIHSVEVSADGPVGGRYAALCGVEVRNPQPNAPAGNACSRCTTESRRQVRHNALAENQEPGS